MEADLYPNRAIKSHRLKAVKTFTMLPTNTQFYSESL